MSGTLTPLAALESVLCTEELNRRPARRPDYERENRALVSLAQALADSPRTILQTLADMILEVFQADSVGISLVTEDGTRFHWPAIAGVWKPHIGEGTPRDFGPCGDVLDRNCPLLFSRPERRYTYFQAVTPPVEECLLVPFYVGGQAVGTIWAIAHDDRRKFDSEDLRMLVSLGTFASAAHQAVEQSHALKEEARDRQETAQGLREMNEALLVSSIRQHELTEQAEEATAALRVSEAFSRGILENSPDCVKVLDAAGRLVGMNANGQCLMEIDDFATVEGRPWRDLWPQEGQAEVLAAIGAARAGGTGKFQSRGLSAKGTPKWWDVIIAPIRDGEGEVIRFVSVSRDITERRQSEQALRESQSRLGYAANAAKLTYVEVDFARGGARTAENFAAVMGFAPPAEQEADVSVGTRLLLEHVVPHDRPSVEAALQDFLGGKPVGKIEYRVLGDDQIERWIESAWSIEFDPSGQPLKTFATNLDITERKRVTEALRESEERYRTLFTSMDEGYCIMEMLFDEHDKPVDYRFLEVNPSFEQQCGLHHATGKRIREFYPNLEEYWFELYGNVALTGEPVRYVNEAKTMEGRWFDVYAFRVGGRDSRKVAVLFTDVKQRKEAEAALRESEERYRNLFNSIDEGFCVIEMIFDEHEQPIDYRFLEANPTFERQTGLHDAIGKRMRELRPNLEAHWFEIYGQVALTGETIRFVNEAKTMEGRWFDVYALRVGAPESRKVAIVFNDITERRQSEAALRQTEQRLRFVMDSMPQKIFTAKPDGDLDYFNPQWTEFTGLSFEQMKDSGWTRFVHPDDVEEKTQRWRQAFDTGEPFQSEHRFRRADGEYRWHFSRAVPMRDEVGQITMWVGSNTDVHDIKLVEAKLQQQAAELSDLHRRKDEFLAMLSHELRSPLAPIANAVQLLGLEKGSESRIHQQARGIIERQLRHLQHLVDDLLEVSRITTGRVQLRQERVAISNIVEGAVETARPQIVQRQHELSVSLPSEPIWLQADAARLEQVIVNLLTNAAKYTEEGGHVWLTVELVSGTALAAGGSPGTSTPRPATTPAASAVPLTGECIIRVRDNGIGIAPELLPHVFDLFTQAERSLDRSQGGLGIGLALVQRLTELHGGTVEAHSILGQGSEFIVRLPLRSGAGRVASGEQDNLGHAPLVTHHSPLATALRVLVVDDNVDTVLTFSMLLRASGHDVQTAHDGLAAVQAAIDYTPDVMLLDIGLPGLNGHEVAKRIRQHPTLKHVVLVALTGYGQDSDRQISQQAGFNHHLVKPARLDQVQTILATVVEQRASRKSSNS